MSTRVEKRPPQVRKVPRQARSRATVEAVIEAGARVLSMAGWAGFTTNKVAETAGISIGSLYQYFPDKIALADAVRQRHLDDCLAVMRGLKERAPSLRAFAEDLVGEMIGVHNIHPRLHRALLDDVPRPPGGNDPNSAYETDYLAHYTAAVAAFRTGSADPPNATVALILSDAIDGVIHNAARRGTLEDPAVRSELVRLVVSYLESHRAADGV